MEKEFTLGRTARSTTENGVEALKRVWVSGRAKTEKATSASGKPDACKVEEYIFGKTAINMKGTG